MIGIKLTLLGGGVLAAATVFALPAQAAIEYPWCVQYSGEDGGGGRNCGFVSYEQCMMTARGAGGLCEHNLFYSEAAPQKPRHPRKQIPNG